MSEDISRRQLFRFKPARLVEAFMKAKAEPAEGEDAPVKMAYIRPPGAASEPVFASQRCATECKACAEACPHDSISFLGPEAGKYEGSPVVNPQEKPCRWCTDFACISACPTGVLKKKKEEPPSKIQVDLLFEASNCLINQGIICDECVLVCPTNVRALRLPSGQLTIDRDKCVGCGLCAYYCANAGEALTIQAKNLETP